MSESANDGGTQTALTYAGISVNVFGRTDVGLVREHNEDNFLIADLTGKNRSIKPEVRIHAVGPKGSLFAICDGMGGAAAGEVASQIAVDTIYERMQEGEEPHSDAALARQLDRAIVEAGERIYTAARVNRRRRGMGTTVTAAVLTGPRLVIGQVGDSRAYIYRQGRLAQLTKDQSLVQQLIDAKQLTEEEARDFDKNNIILQALGTSQKVLVDMTSAILRRGDILVLCSDGLCGLVSDEGISKALAQTEDPMEACRQLTDMARDAGGHDNITVIVAVFGGEELLVPGISGEEISYQKYKFDLDPEGADGASTSRLPDTTPPPRVSRATDPRIPAKITEHRTEDPGPEKQKVQTGLLSAAVAALLVGIALIVYIVMLKPPSDIPAGEKTSAPMGDDMAQDEEEISVPPSRASSRGRAGATKARAKPAGARGSAEAEMDDAPLLAPTPEGAIIGRNRASRSAAAAKKNTQGKGAVGGQGATPNNDVEPAQPQAEEDSMPPAQAAKPVPAKPLEEKKEDSAADKALRKKGASKKASPARKNAPKQLDDNPFE